VLVSEENRPAAWIVGTERLAQVVAARGAASHEVYERTLDVIAVEQYEHEVLTLG